MVHAPIPTICCPCYVPAFCYVQCLPFPTSAAKHCPQLMSMNDLSFEKLQQAKPCLLVMVSSSTGGSQQFGCKSKLNSWSNQAFKSHLHECMGFFSRRLC